MQDMLLTNRSPRVSVLSTALFLIGLFFIANSQLNITGAVTGITTDSSISSLAGLVLVFAAGTVHLSSAEKEYRPRDIKDLIERIGVGPKVAIVMDASRIIESENKGTRTACQ